MMRSLLDKIFIYLGKKIHSATLRSKRIFLKKNGLLKIGRKTYGAEKIEFFWYKGSDTKVSIGKFCSIGPNVIIILGGIHPIDWVSLYPFRIRYQLPEAYEDGMPTTKGDISIGNDVWIGTGVTIMSGVQIGNGAVITSNSVVTRDVPPFSVCGGVPTKVIRNRFTEEQITNLQSIAWWDWSDEKIRESVDLLSSNNIQSFIEHNIE